jgi:hypothetical protein
VALSCTPDLVGRVRSTPVLTRALSGPGLSTSWQDYGAHGSYPALRLNLINGAAFTDSSVARSRRMSFRVATDIG